MAGYQDRWTEMNYELLNIKSIKKKKILVDWRMALVRQKCAFIMQEKFSIIMQKWNSQVHILLNFNNVSKTFN